MKKTIGRTDKADFPQLNLYKIPIKIDTGANTSSMHCEEIKEENNKLKCLFIYSEYSQSKTNEYFFEDYSQKKVRSSNGETEIRYVIKTNIKLFGQVYSIFLTLTDRADMKYPVLLGRRFLKNKFIVDTDLTDISYKNI